MKSAFGFTSIVVAGLVLAACLEAKSKSPDSTAPAKVDGRVIQTSAIDDSTREEKEITVGDKAPAWKKLTGTDGKRHSLKDLKKDKAVAVVFTCNTCPVAQAYESRLIKLANDYKDKGVAIVAINVNENPGNDLDAMKRHAEEKGFTFAYLKDPSQETGRQFGATCTPHVFLLDAQQKIVYMGAIDDSMDPSSVKHHSLQDAIDAALAGKKPTVTKTRQFGCGIQYE